MGGRPAGDLVADKIVQELPPKLDQMRWEPATTCDVPATMMVVMGEVSDLS